MIFAIVGTIGSGKTILLTLFTVWYYLSGYTIYSNYPLKVIPYNTLEKLKDLDELREDTNFKKQKVFIALDEGWLSFDSRVSGRNIDITKYILQSRKMGADIGITVQDLSQMDKRVRNILHWVLEPTILEYKDGIPFILKVEHFFTTDKTRKINKFFAVTIVEIKKKIHNVCNLYETFNFVDEIKQSEQSDYYESLVEKYSKFNHLSKTDLSSLIWGEENIKLGNDISTTRCNKLANWIHVLKNMELPL